MTDNATKYPGNFEYTRVYSSTRVEVLVSRNAEADIWRDTTTTINPDTAHQQMQSVIDQMWDFGRLTPWQHQGLSRTLTDHGLTEYTPTSMSLLYVYSSEEAEAEAEALAAKAATDPDPWFFHRTDDANVYITLRAGTPAEEVYDRMGVALATLSSSGVITDSEHATMWDTWWDHGYFLDQDVWCLTCPIGGDPTTPPMTSIFGGN